MSSSAPPVSKNIVEPPSASSTLAPEFWDDFTQLNGIGPATHKQLHESLGIHTLAELAFLSPQGLVQQFKYAERSISMTQAEFWITQAQTHGPSTDQNSSTNLEVESPNLSDDDQTLDAIQHPSTCLESPPYRLDKYQVDQGQLAQLQWLIEVHEVSSLDKDEDVEKLGGEAFDAYRTIIRHRQSGDILAYWPGVNLDAVHDWLKEQWQHYQVTQKSVQNQQGRDELEKEGNGKSRSPLPATITPVITQLSFYQPLRHVSHSTVGISSPVRPIRQTLKRMEPFALALQFKCPALDSLNQFTGVINANMGVNDSAIRAVVEVYAHHRESGSVKNLGHISKEILLPGCHIQALIPKSSEPEYSVLLTNAYLSKTGMYRFKILVKLVGIQSTPGYLEIPMVQAI
ncbi:MAG: hypothetical protein AAGD25_21360 [Cyanobacteria bacterium P01_F01_bin.150]